VIPCLCGCEEFFAHENLYDCFIRIDGAGYDSHGAGCGVCLAEAAVASKLLDAGTPATEVAERIVEPLRRLADHHAGQTIPDPESPRTPRRTSPPERPSPAPRRRPPPAAARS
jgi:hypothetical protein